MRERIRFEQEIRELEQPVPSYKSAPVFGLRQRIVEIAKREWNNWKQGNLSETDPKARPLLLNYLMNYRLNGYSENKANKIIDEMIKDPKKHPWSAVFISYVMREAGAANAFSYASSHTTYIAAAKKARNSMDVSKFLAYMISEVKPVVGDLVCRDRAEKRSSCAGTDFDNVEKGGISHSDIVVGVQLDHIVILGGNTAQDYPSPGKKANTVGQRRLKLDEEGFVIPDQRRDGCKYFAIVKPPTPSAALGTPQDIQSLPLPLQLAIRGGFLTLEVALAILSGNRDVNNLTNMVFYALYPKWRNEKLKSDDPEAKVWVRIRDGILSLMDKVPAVDSMPVAPLTSQKQRLPYAETGSSSSSGATTLALLLDRIRIASKKYIMPRTQLVEVDGYERAEPRGDVWCQQAKLTLEEGALARMVASEVGTKPPQYMLAVIEATMNEAIAKKISVFQLITMQGLKVKGKTPKSAGFFGRQSGRWCSSIQDPTFQHLEAVRVALTAPEHLVVRDGRRWVDGKVMDRGLQAGKKLKYNAVTIVEKWGAEGWEWVGPIYEPDGRTALLDPYLLMVFRFVGRGKANIRPAIEAMLEGRRKWNIKVD